MTVWLFLLQYVFSANVMVRVATRPAENPMGIVARKLSLGGGMARHAPRLSLPGKLVFPSHQNSGHFSMLGLGDIVMPGLLLCFVMRWVQLYVQYIAQFAHMRNNPREEGL